MTHFRARSQLFLKGGVSFLLGVSDTGSLPGPLPFRRVANCPPLLDLVARIPYLSQCPVSNQLQAEKPDYPPGSDASFKEG